MIAKANEALTGRCQEFRSGRDHGGVRDQWRTFQRRAHAVAGARRDHEQCKAHWRACDVDDLVPSVLTRHLRQGAFGTGELASLLAAAAPLLSAFLYCAFAAITLRYMLVALRGGTIVPGGEAGIVRRHLPVILVFSVLTYLFHLSYLLTSPPLNRAEPAPSVQAGNAPPRQGG